ncbi:MAG: hypothetical protein PHC75_06460 [Burkholderiales bacterium]|nr:hypothetical protein [Burkholderiales bacterium]
MLNFKKTSTLTSVPLMALLASCGAGSNDTTNGYVYLVLDSNVVQQCQVVNNAVNAANCKSMTGSFNSPTAIAFDASKTYAYVANSGNSTLSMCTLNNDKSFNQCGVLTLSSAALNAPTSLAITSNKIYIANNNSTVTLCDINNNGTLSSCSNTPVNHTLKSITVKDNNSLYGLTDNRKIYSYQLPSMLNTEVNYNESGISNQISFNPSNNLLYIAAKNNPLLGGGIYGCSTSSNPATCMTAFSTLQAILPIPLVAPIYTITTNNTQAYFIDYALNNPTQIDSYATLINSCSVDGNGAVTNCSASVLSTNKPSDNAKIALTYLPI